MAKSKNNEYPKSITIDGVEVFLTKPDELDIQVVGAREIQKQLLACWISIEEDDIPLTPRLLGRPGVGKTTLAYAVGKAMNQDVYIFQCTMDTRPEDLIITPVIADNNKIRYQASPLVTAMIRGGVAILDEGNRMMEKAWASLAPLFDMRRYVESITAGIKIKAHPEFRCAVTMNNDSSTFEVPEYIMSRLQPQIFIDFPSRNEEKEILGINVPFAEEDMLVLMADFLERTHQYDEPFTSRDGIHILRYARKLVKKNDMPKLDAIKQAIRQILGDNAVTYLDPNYKPKYSFGSNLSDILNEYSPENYDEYEEDDEEEDDDGDIQF
jgi:hypothetical protein